MVGAADRRNAPVQIQVAFAAKKKRGQFAHWMTQALRSVPKVAYLGRNRRQCAGLRNLQDTRLLGRTQRALPRLLGVILILVLGATECTAQSCRTDYGNNSSGLNDGTTNRVVRLLKQGLRQCQTLNSVYRYDCYRQNYRAAGRQLAGNPAYAPAQQALRDVETTLVAVLDANADPTTRPIRRRGKSYSAISERAIPRSKAAFAAALDGAATKLLRSVDSDSIHFARIASVLDSNKVFLRSAWTPATEPTIQRI
ncbi:hypothetical protein [Sedimentitalea todarodis]|uniref:Imelysin-like domain-containing protein n=1 Tax=Sedimentitalea todarodis TaxID=1631240 RepID=A0ABU3VLL0_9RHOB|nr:hypothetical protein [Sedimentitalea todarodis]MDU9007102.1 hypothetical protein [Sedimentitalea todarodis]